MTVLSIQWLTALGKIPGERREPSLDRRYGVGVFVSRDSSGGTGRDVEAHGLWIRRKHLKTLSAAPAGKVAPVGGIGAPRVG